MRVSTNRECTWSVKSEAPWLSLSSPAEGQGEASIEFTVAANTEPSSRTAAITLNDQRLSISQEGSPCGFQLSSSREVIDPGGGDRTVQITATGSQCEWTAATEAPWITIAEGRQGRGNGAVAFHVAAAGSVPRTGTLVVARQAVLIEQGPTPVTDCRYSIATTAFSVDSSGGSGEVPVSTSAGCAWTAESQVAWITITSGSAGSGAGVVRFRVTATDGPSRVGRVRIAGSFVTVEQSAGCAYQIDRSAFSAPVSGGPGAVSVRAGGGCGWSTSTHTPWISITSGAKSSGDGRVDFMVAANSGPARTGSLEIAGRTVAVTQPNGCAYGIAPSRQDVGGTGGATPVSVTTAAQCPWTATSSVGWITPSPASGLGPGQVQLGVAANLSPPRTGTLTIAGQTVTVNQSSQCTYILSPPHLTYDANGGNGAVLVIVSGPCTWTAESGADWIRMVPGYTSGTGGGLVQFTVAPHSGAARTSSVTIAGQNIVVTQGGR